MTDLVRDDSGGITGGCAGRDAARRRQPVKAGGLGSRRQQADPQAAWATATRRLSAGPRSARVSPAGGRSSRRARSRPRSCRRAFRCANCSSASGGITWSIWATSLRGTARMTTCVGLAVSVLGAGVAPVCSTSLVSVRGPLELVTLQRFRSSCVLLIFKRMETTRAISGVGTGLMGRDERE